MRCKNCGSENEDGRYICQNCGSPLYDESDEIMENGPYPDEYEDDDKEYEKKATRKSIIIIIALVVVLVAVIAGVVFAVTSLGGSKTPETDSSDKISVSDNYSEPPSSSSLNNTTEKTTEKTTESTTEKTTESTTKATTTTTTTRPSSTKPTEAKFKIYVDVDGNGNILGEGEYVKGKRVTLVATPDAGAQFVGWYENGIIVASGTKYSFTVDGERHLTALFQKAPEEVSDNEPAENE